MKTNLKKNICSLYKPGSYTCEMKSEIIDKCLLLGLQYACCYWVYHPQHSDAVLRDDNQARIFLQSHLLHRLEAPSLIGKISEGVLDIASLESIFKVRNTLRVSI